MKRDERYSVIGGKHRAESRYSMIRYRLAHPEERKNRAYKGVKLLIDKKTFVEWFMANDFEGASVDRIDKNKDYSMDNIQLIPLDENIRKDKVKAKDGMCECFMCKQTKPLELFVKDHRRKNGYSTLCKACDAVRYKERKARKKVG